MTAFSQPERRGLERMQLANPDTHPDADLLSGFAEQSLTGRERDQVLVHLAACVACREVVALAGSPLVEPVPEPVRKRGLWEMPLFRWGAVAATTVVVVAAVMLSMHQPGLQKTSSSTAAIQNEELPAPVVQQEDKMVGVPATKTLGTAQNKVVTEPASTLQAPTPPHRALHLQQQARYERPGSAAEKNGDKKEEQKEAAPAAIGGLVAGNIVSPAPMAGASARDSASSNNFALKAKVADAKPAPAAAPVSAPPRSVNENVTVEASSQAVQVEPENTPLKDLEVSGRNVAGLSANGKLDSSTAAVLRKAAPVATQWRVKKGKLLQRSQAKAWLPVMPEHKFRAVSLTQNNVWAGGDNGLLYHSPDNGQTWTPVPVHSGTTALTGNIVALTFSDAQHGSLKTSTGETWTTADGGQSWQKK